MLGQEITRDDATSSLSVVPPLSNSLSEQLRRPDITFGQFKRSLKTFMFG